MGYTTEICFGESIGFNVGTDASLVRAWKEVQKRPAFVPVPYAIESVFWLRFDFVICTKMITKSRG